MSGSPNAGGLSLNFYVYNVASVYWNETQPSQSIGVFEITIVGLQIVLLDELTQIKLGEGGLKPKYYLMV